MGVCLGKNPAVEDAPHRKSHANPQIDMEKYDRRGKMRDSTIAEKLSKLMIFQRTERNSVAPMLPVLPCPSEKLLLQASTKDLKPSTAKKSEDNDDISVYKTITPKPAVTPSEKTWSRVSAKHTSPHETDDQIDNAVVNAGDG